MFCTLRDDDAVLRDRVSGVFTDPAKVHEIGHHGTTLTVPGFHLSKPSAQRISISWQPSRGIRFAAGNPEAIFIASSTRAA